MGRDITIHIKIGRRELLAALVLGLLVVGPRPLSTETLTLNTYYPSPYGVYNQIRSTQDAYLGYGGGKVGVGTTAPAGKFDVEGAGNIILNPAGAADKIGIGTNAPLARFHIKGTGGGNVVFDDALQVMAIGATNGTVPGGVPGYGLKVAASNIEVQGAENASYLRVGDAWGVDGIYSEGGDLVLGSANGPIHIGPPPPWVADNQYLAGMCKSVWYAYPATTTCPNAGVGWSVMGWGTVAGNIDNTTPIPLSGFMNCCKLQTP